MPRVSPPAQTYGGYAGNVAGIAGNPDAAVSAFTLMKVIGRDMWIGVWAFVLSLIATARWERTGIQSKSRAAEIWNRLSQICAWIHCRIGRGDAGGTRV